MSNPEIAQCSFCAWEGYDILLHVHLKHPAEAKKLQRPAVEDAPPAHCWHKEIDDEGFCKACGERAAIKIEGMHQSGGESLDMLRRGQNQNKAPKASAPVKDAPRCRHGVLMGESYCELCDKWSRGEDATPRTPLIAETLHQHKFIAGAMPYCSCGQKFGLDADGKAGLQWDWHIAQTIDAALRAATPQPGEEK
jgi:hypothetical protein